MAKMIFQYIVCQNNKPLKSVDGEFVIFSTKKAATEMVKQMKSRGDRHIYGHDEFNAKDLKVITNYLYLQL
jgi:hypothetical protein